MLLTTGSNDLSIYVAAIDDYQERVYARILPMEKSIANADLLGIPLDHIIAMKGRFGPYLKYGERNISLPRKANPLHISLEECEALIKAEAAKPAAGAVLAEFADGIQLINGRYGPYLKQNGVNYRIPKGKDAAALTEADCRAIISKNHK